MKVSDAGPSLKKLSIEIPAETVAAKIRESLDTLATEAELPGFRKGKVPKALVEKRFGASVKKEAKGQLVAQAYQKAIEQEKLRVVGDPDGSALENIEIVDGQPLAFEIEVEVMPEFEVPAIDGIDIKKPILEVADTVVEEEFKKVAINEGSLETRDSSEAGDYVTGHAVMTGSDGTVFYDLKSAVIQVPPADKNGKGMILGILVDDFSKQLGTLKPGGEVTIKATGPDNHEVEKIRKTALTITFKAERVDRILPATAEQLVAAFGVEDESRLKDLIRTRLQQNATIRQQSAMRAQVEKYLADKTKMELPKRLTSQQATRMLERRRLELMYRGVDPLKIEEHMAELRASTSANASHTLKMFFVLSKIAEDLNVRVSDGELNGRIAQMAFQRNIRPEQLRQELIRTNQIAGIYAQIRDHKAVDAIISKAKVTEMPAEEFQKAMKDMLEE
ncbi:MAG: trigger factor [bacterium]|nr:trigger factor [bacterium]